jgi:uncharacterized membrane protein
MKTKTTTIQKEAFSLFEILFLFPLIHRYFSRRLVPVTIKITLFLVLILSSTLSFGQSSSCKVLLKAEKDRNSRSTSSGDTYYSMVISNTATSTDTFSLSSANVNNSCANNDGSSAADNVNLTAAFVDESMNSINTISLNPGQTINFFVKITVPTNATVNKWNCTEITATSNSCSDYKVNTVLHTLVSDPNMD